MSDDELGDMFNPDTEMVSMAASAGAHILQYRKLRPTAKAPWRQYPTDVGYDLTADLKDENGRHRRVLIPPHCTRKVPTGIVCIPPKGFFLTVCSRSGLASGTTPLFVPNGPGVIDPGYRGELFVLLYNGGVQSHYIQHGNRVGQLVVVPITTPTVIEVKEMAPTDRGEAGFGSTGD